MWREMKIAKDESKCFIMDEEDFDGDFFDLVGDDNFGVLSCGLSRENLNFNNDLFQDLDGLFRAFYMDHEISEIGVTIEELQKMTNLELQASTLEEKKNLIISLFENGDLSDWDLVCILKKTTFEKAILLPFYAYIHSGIAISLEDPNDKWDSGFAGFVWYEIDDNTSLEEAQKYLKSDFELYDEYIEGEYHTYYNRVMVHDKDGWREDDSCAYFATSFDDAWDQAGVPITMETREHFSEETLEEVRRSIPLDDNSVLDYFDNL